MEPVHTTIDIFWSHVKRERETKGNEKDEMVGQRRTMAEQQ